jgi:flagellar hook-length control protein FliK
MDLQTSGDTNGSSSSPFAGVLNHHLLLASGLAGHFQNEGPASTAKASSAPVQTASTSANPSLHDILAQAASGGGAPQVNLHQLQMTQDDFASLKQGLADLGFTDEEISGLSSRIGTSQGLTWGQFGQAVREKVSGQSVPDTFSGEEKFRLNSLLSKLGFSPPEAQKAVDDLQQSGPQGALAPLVQNAQQAEQAAASQKGSAATPADTLLGGANTSFWSTLSNKLDALPQSQTANVSQSEFASLAKAMSLPSQVQDSVAKLFAANGGQDVPLSQIKDALKQFQGQNSQSPGAGDSLPSFKQLVNQTVDTAQERAMTWAKSSALPSPSGQPDPKQYKREVIRTVEKALSSFESGPEAQSATQSAASASQGQAKNSQAQPTSQNGTQNPAPGAKSQVNAPVMPGQPGSQSPGGDPSQTFSQNQGKNPGFGANSGEAPPAKTIQTFENSTITAIKNELQGLMAQQQATAPAAAPANSSANPPAGGENFSRAEVLQQIQNGILRNLGQGTKQLTLELSPANLGRLNIVLQVRNSELTATIKSPNAETSNIIHQNLAQLKSSLEQQGLTVSKIDVQTSLAENGMASNWSGADSHNESQNQREAMQQSLLSARMGQGVPGGLAQDMQSTGNEAIISQTGLDIFA